jgi:hypothetical protein
MSIQHELNDYTFIYLDVNGVCTDTAQSYTARATAAIHARTAH